MIVVTGTKRSGTSLWMQVLVAAGFEVIGRPYMSHWGESIRDANPRGFYESRFRAGIYHATNPHPRTGRFLAPADTRRHVVKVFIPGLVRSDLAFLDGVVATMRPWRTYVASLARLHAMEDAWYAAHPEAAARRRRARQRGRRPLAVQWWFENHALLRDTHLRRYPALLTTYDRLLRDPEAEVDRVLGFLGGGDGPRALAAVEPGLRSPLDLAGVGADVDPADAAIFDALYAAVDQGRRPDPTLRRDMRALHRRYVARWERVPAPLVLPYDDDLDAPGPRPA